MRPAVPLVAILGLLLAGCSGPRSSSKARPVHHDKKEIAKHRELGETAYKVHQFESAIQEFAVVLESDSRDPGAILRVGLSHFQLGHLEEAMPFLLKARETSPDNPYVRIAIATTELVRGHLKEAHTEAAQIVDRYPSYLDALALLVESSASSAQATDALKRLERLHTEMDGVARYHVLIGLAQAYRGDARSGEHACRDAVEANPETVEARVWLARMRIARGKLPEAEVSLRQASELASAISNARVRLSAFYLLVDRPEESARILAEMTERMADFLPAWRLLAALAHDYGLDEESASAVDFLLERSPHDPLGLLVRGRSELRRGDADAAVATLGTLAAAAPGSASAHVELARALIQAGNPEAARGELLAALALAPDHEPAALLLAVVELESGQAAAAVERLAARLAKAPRGFEARVLLARAELESARPEEALAESGRIIAELPQDPRGPYLAGKALAALGRPGEAQAAFEAALALAPGALAPTRAVAELMLAGGQGEEATARVAKEIERAPASGDLLNLLGEVAAARQLPGEAEAAYRKALDLSPRLIGARVELGMLYAASGRTREAAEQLEHAVDLEPKNQSLLLACAWLHAQSGNFRGAEDTYRKLLALEPRHALAANNLADLYAEHGGDPAEALRLAHLAHDADPADARYADTLGRLLSEREPQAALDLLRMAAAALPEEPQVLCHLGMTEQRIGDAAAARASIERAFALAPEFPGAEACRAALAQIR